jgi:hypothetical protein
MEPLVALVEEDLEAGMTNGREAEFARERISKRRNEKHKLR